MSVNLQLYCTHHYFGNPPFGACSMVKDLEQPQAQEVGQADGNEVQLYHEKQFYEHTKLCF